MTTRSYVLPFYIRDWEDHWFATALDVTSHPCKTNASDTCWHWKSSDGRSHTVCLTPDGNVSPCLEVA